MSMASPPPPLITQITDRASHDRVVARAEAGVHPTVFYVSHSSQPTSRAFTPRYEALAARYAAAGMRVTFTQTEFSASTSMLFKFAPNQLPVLTLMTREGDPAGGMWCRTIMGADAARLESGIEGMLERAGMKPEGGG